MRYPNLVYILALGLLVLALPQMRNQISHSTEFYGIAEQPVVTYNLDYPVEILQIVKIQGSAVIPGDTLLKLKRLDQKSRENLMHYELSDNAVKLQSIRQIALHEQSILQNQKLQLDRDHRFQTQQIQYKIDQVKAAQALITGTSENSLRQTALENELRQANIQYNQELAEINLKLLQCSKSLNVDQKSNYLKNSKLQNDLYDLQKAAEDLVFIAQDSGVVGQLEFGVGDRVPEFTPIAKLFRQHPNRVIFYTGEQHLALVTIGDSVLVQSIHQKENYTKGVVTALGNRITALPERLKKVPELRAWGREVQVTIPDQNNFLQGEKVKVLMP